MIYITKLPEGIKSHLGLVAVVTKADNLSQHLSMLFQMARMLPGPSEMELRRDRVFERATRVASPNTMLDCADRSLPFSLLFGSGITYMELYYVPVVFEKLAHVWSPPCYEPQPGEMPCSSV